MGAGSCWRRREVHAAAAKALGLSERPLLTHRFFFVHPIVALGDAADSGRPDARVPFWLSRPATAAGGLATIALHSIRRSSSEPEFARLRNTGTGTVPNVEMGPLQMLKCRWIQLRDTESNIISNTPTRQFTGCGKPYNRYVTVKRRG